MDKNFHWNSAISKRIFQTFTRPLKNYHILAILRKTHKYNISKLKETKHTPGVNPYKQIYNNIKSA